LPRKIYHTYTINFSSKEREIYDEFLDDIQKVYGEMVNNTKTYAHVLALFTRLRQCCIAPYLTTVFGSKDEEEIERVKNLLNKKEVNKLAKWAHDEYSSAGIKSAKIKKIVKILKNIRRRKPWDKIVVFSSFKSCLNVLRRACEVYLPDFDYAQIDGDVSIKDRDMLLQEFKYQPYTNGLFMTYKVGSEGINLTQANHVICIEPWWTPAVHLQAEARCWRLGQNKEVHIYKIYIEDSIEEQILEVCNGKNLMTEKLLEGTISADVGLDKKTLHRILFKSS
jgi:SNF2 family DNA or RNA helicase